MFYFHPYLGKIPILTNIFQLGWNHQAITKSGFHHPLWKEDYEVVLRRIKRLESSKAPWNSCLFNHQEADRVRGWNLTPKRRVREYPSTRLLYVAKATYQKSYSLIWMRKPKMQSSPVAVFLGDLRIPNQNLRFHQNRRANPPHCQCPVHPCPWSKAFFSTKWWVFPAPFDSHHFPLLHNWMSLECVTIGIALQKGGDEKQLSWFPRNFTESWKFWVEVWKLTLMCILYRHL